MRRNDSVLPRLALSLTGRGRFAALALMAVASLLPGAALGQDDAPHTGVGLPPVLKIGSHAPDFNLPGIDGKTHNLAEYASSRYVLPRSITLMMKRCDDANAWWNPPTLTEALCYEMAEDFVDLYQGYTEKTTSNKKMRANKLMARNIERLSLAHDTSTGSVEASSGSTAALATRDRFEKMALDLDSGAVALFTQTANRRAAVDAKWRSPK